MAIFFSIPFIGIVKKASALTEKKKGLICEGVFVSGIDLSGKTAEEAKILLKDQFERLMAKKIEIEIYSDGEIRATDKVSFSEIGLESAGSEIIEKAVAEALEIGTKGNLIERYKELKDTEENKVVHKLDFKYDEGKLDAFIKELSNKYEMKPEDAVLTRVNGIFEVTGGQTGYEFDDKDMASAIKKSIDDFVMGLPETMSAETKFQAKLNEVRPKYDKDELSKIKDLLGSYTTTYGAGATGRILNIINGAKLINGSLLLPGEVMSANKKMYPYTITNGYHMGGAFLNGKVVNDIGGGICQVSTTLYNAALYSEIGIEQRQNHSMTVSYVPLARDAAIAGDYKDLVIKNTREEPIYIEAVTGGGKITFNIYGQETRDTANRKVDFVTVTHKTIAPGNPVITEDPNQPEDFEKVVQGAWTGFKTELYKVVKVNGVETERTLVNQSNYKANPAYVIKGTKKIAPPVIIEAPKPVEPEKKKEQEKKSDKKKAVEKKKDDEKKKGEVKKKSKKPSISTEEDQVENEDVDENENVDEDTE